MNARFPFAALALLTVTGCGGAPEPIARVPAEPSEAAPSEAKATPAAPVASAAPAAGAPAAAAAGTEVLLCDGKTKAVFPQGTPGDQIASALMNEWIRKNPDQNWEATVRSQHSLEPAADNKKLIGQGQGPTYGGVTAQDVALWKTETETLALAGSRVFHSGDELGTTVGVSCDMCHPNGANTHPETYPKFQAQLGRVVLLRDMINWCLQHPVRAQPMSADDPRMRAMEAYIYAQRRGKVLEYGKH
jgi:thiosulfate dehydrogenase